MKNNIQIIAYADNSPVVKRGVSPQPATSSYVDYSEYGIYPMYYYPSFGLAIVLIKFCILVAIIQGVISLGIILFFVLRKQKIVVCKNCGMKILLNRKKPQILCPNCNSRLQ